MSRGLLTEKQIRILVKNILLSEAKFIDFEAGEDDSGKSSSSDSVSGDSGSDWTKSDAKMTAPCGEGGTSKSLGDCDPEFAKKVEQLLVNLKNKGFNAKIGGTWRSAACQLEKFCQGYSQKTSPMGYHVSVDGGGSPKAVAADIVHGSGGYHPPEGEKFWNAVGEEARALGLTWGGDWKTFKDRPHVQVKGGNPYEQSTIQNLKSLGLDAKPGMWNKQRKGIGCEDLPDHVVSKWKSKYGGLAEDIVVKEGEFRALIRGMLLKEAKFIDFDAGHDHDSSSSDSSSGPVHVKDPVSIQGGNYPEENVRHVEAAMTEKGITNKYVRIGILCTIAKESNFKPKSEKTYHSTGLSRIYQIWPKLKKLGDAKVEAMKKSTSPSDGHKKAGLGFFDYLYGGRYGNGPEKTGDGSRYRGRGFNQVTFKGTYKKYGKLAGIDLVGNPDLLNKPDVAAKVAVAFLANRIKKGHGTVNPDAKSYDEGIKIAAEANCKSPGAKKDCSRAISSATKRLPHFKYGGGGENLAKNDKNKNDDSKDV